MNVSLQMPVPVKPPTINKSPAEVQATTKPQPLCPQTGDTKEAKSAAKPSANAKTSQDTGVVPKAQKVHRTEVDKTLTEEERKDLEKQEKVVAESENKGLESAAALAHIHDKKLYRETHTTFQDYCEQRLGFKRSHGNRLMNAGKVYTAIKNLQKKDETICMPTSESQLRALSGMEGETLENAWKAAVAKAGDSKPTAAIVEAIARGLKETKPGKKTAHKAKVDMKALKDAFLKLYAVIKKNEQEEEVELAEELKQLMQIDEKNVGAEEKQNGAKEAKADKA